MARKWGSVCIVTPSWIYDCVKLGYKVAEDDSKYAVKREVSTPERDQCEYKPRVGPCSIICLK